MTDEGFLHALHEKPNDDATRLVYADWLEEQDDEASQFKAEYIRLDCELATLPAQAKGIRLLKLRRLRLAEQLDSAWVAVVSKERVERCTFAFECPLKWENLQSVADSTTTRYCNSCKQPVYFCATLPEAQTHALQGHCIAVDARIPRGPNDLVTLGTARRTLGKVLPRSLHPKANEECS